MPDFPMSHSGKTTGNNVRFVDRTELNCRNSAKMTQVTASGISWNNDVVQVANGLPSRKLNPVHVMANLAILPQTFSPLVDDCAVFEPPGDGGGRPTERHDSAGCGTLSLDKGRCFP
jgi:hypothetical protein